MRGILMKLVYICSPYSGDVEEKAQKIGIKEIMAK